MLTLRPFPLAISVVVMIIAGCSRFPLEYAGWDIERTRETYTKPRDVGEWRVAGFIDRNARILGVHVLDPENRPMLISAASLEGRIVRTGGEILPVTLAGEGYEVEPESMEDYAGERSAATRYSARFSWIEEEPRCRLEVAVPMPDGETYDLEFELGQVVRSMIL